MSFNVVIENGYWMDKIIMENSKFRSFLNPLSNSHFLVTIIGFILIIISIAVHVGTLYNITALTSIYPTWNSMKLSTVICFLLGGIALLLLSNKNRGFYTSIIGVVSLSIILLISGLSLVQDITGSNFGIDGLLIKATPLYLSPIYIVRMPCIMAINFVLITCGFLLLVRRSALIWISQTFVWLVFFIALISLNCYIYSANLHSASADFMTMPLYAAVLFILFSLGVLLINPDSGIVGIILKKSKGGYFIRRMLPIILLVPLSLAILENIFEEAKVVEPNFGDAILGASIFAVLSIMVFIISLRIDREEKTLTEAETTISHNEMIFREFAKNIDIVFFTCSADLSQVLYASPAYEKMWGRSIESLYKNPLEWFQAIIPDDKNKVHETFFIGLQQGKTKASVECRIQRPDGTIRDIFVRIIQLKDSSQKAFCVIGIAIDLTDLKLEKLYNSIKKDILGVIESKKTLNEVAPVIIKIICEAHDWDMGEIWLVDESKDLLRCYNAWHKGVQRFNDFDNENRQHTFRIGEGLPGKIWKDRQPIWISDYSFDHMFPRSRDADKAELNSAFGIPILYQDKFYGVLEFFSYSIRNPDEVLLALMRDIGNSLGTFIQQVYTNEQIQTISKYDVLTGLLNRSTLEENLEYLITDRKSETIAILLLDIDRFKLINAALGYADGDILLKSIAQRLCELMGDEKTYVARLGADEFIVYIPNVNKDIALDNADKIKQGFSAPFGLNQEEISLAVSIGVAIYPNDGLDGKTLIANADLAMVHAKELGGNRIEVFSKSFPRIASKKLAMQTEIPHAITKNQFIMAYQPQIDLKTGNICGAEALVRWEHPVKGLIYPNAFIKYAEEMGLIVPLNEHILRLVFQQIGSSWSGPPISVNISAQQFMDGFHLVEYLELLMNEFAVGSKHIELEITEGILMENTHHVLAVLTALNKLGFQIAMDDFGTGFSSFSYVSRLPTSKIKIDRSFISGLPDNIANAKIVKAIISMTHSIDKKVVAEGAETKAEIEFLTAVDCDIVQGFYYYKPMPFQEFDALITKKKGN